MADCSLEEYDAHPPKLTYTLVFKNGGSHLPADEDGMLASHSFVMTLLGGGLICLAWGINRQLQETKQVHLAVLFVFTSTLLQLLSVVCEISHLWVYSTDGKGMRWRWVMLPAGAVSARCPHAMCLGQVYFLPDGFLFGGAPGPLGAFDPVHLDLARLWVDHHPQHWRTRRLFQGLQPPPLAAAVLTLSLTCA